MAMGLKPSIKQYSRLAKDDTPQHYMSPFQRQDIYNRVAGLADAKRGQAEAAVAHRTADTSSPQFQMQMNKLAEGTAGVVGANVANIEQQDLAMGAEQRQRKLANMAQSIQQKQQFTQMKQAQDAAAKAKEGEEKKGGGGGLGAGLGSAAGAIAGQILIPIPGVGAAIGSAAGGAIGGAAGESATGGDAGAGAASGAVSGLMKGIPGVGPVAGATGITGSMLGGTTALNTAGGLPTPDIAANGIAGSTMGPALPASTAPPPSIGITPGMDPVAFNKSASVDRLATPGTNPTLDPGIMAKLRAMMMQGMTPAA